MKPQKNCLVVLFDRVGPYHFARLQATARLVSTAAIEMCARDDTYAWDLVEGADNFNRITLFNAAESRTRSSAETARRVHGALEQCRPAAVAIPGWSDRGALSALEWCARRRVPTVIMSDSTRWDHKRVFWKEWIKSQVVRMASTGLVAGTPHADYIRNLGLPGERVFLGYDAVDNDYFAKNADEARSQGPALRKKLGLPEHYFLASARFIEKKNLPRLLQGYAQYRALSAKAKSGKPNTEIRDLVLLGDGPLRDVLHNQIAALGLCEHVFLHGFRQYAELPACYGLADVFVHASTTEQWGLVVNEAMASGLPVLVSNRCGCAMDLVQEGVTGFTFDPWNVDQLAERMLGFTTDKVDLAAMGSAARKHISNWGTGRFADGLAEAAEVAMKSPLPRSTVLDRLFLKLLLRLNSRVNE